MHTPRTTMDPIETVRTRLRWFGLSSAIAGVAYVLLLVFVLPGEHRPVSAGTATGVVGIGLVVAGAILGALLAVLAGRRGPDGTTLVRLGLAYEVVGALVIATQTLLAYQSHLRDGTPWDASGPGFVGVWVLFAAALVQPRWSMAVLAGLIATAFEPALLLLHQQLSPTLDPDVGGVLFAAAPNAACALLAAIPAALAGRARREAVRERERTRYRLLETIAVAGPGTTWRAEHDALDEPVCVRVVRATDLAPLDPTRANAVLQRFARAAEASRRVRSPHAITVLRSRIEDEALHAVTEWVEGFDLDALIREHGPLPAERVVYLLGQVCHALHDAHVHDVVHGDLRPSHVVVTVRGIEPDFVKVGGFGLGTPIVGGDPTHPERMIAGTPGFVSPQAIRGHGPTPSDDVYALGALAYWMLTGTTVFDGSTVEVLASTLSDEPVPPSQRTSHPLDAGLERVVLQCLDKDPRRRPASARQVGGALAATGLAPHWTEEACRRWWEAHAAHLLPPRPEIEADGNAREVLRDEPGSPDREPDFFRRRAGKRRVPPSEADEN